MPTKLQTLQDHCQRFERGLAEVASVDEAEALRERICRELGASCRSEIVQLLLEEHAQVMIRERFAAPPPG